MLNGKDDLLYVFYTKAFTKPESILLSTVDLTQDWKNWKFSKPILILEPEMKWEGVDLKLTKSKYGGTGKMRSLRDPYIFEDDGVIYLLYSVMGEKGIAIGTVKGLS